MHSKTCCCVSSNLLLFVKIREIQFPSVETEKQNNENVKEELPFKEYEVIQQYLGAYTYLNKL